MLARKSLLMFLVNGIGASGGLVSLFFIARYMTPTAYGMLGFALSVAGLIGTITDFGLNDAHVKRLSGGADPADCLTTFAVIRTVQAAFYLVIIAAAGWTWHALFGFTDATSVGALMAASLWVAIQSLQSIPAATFNAFQQAARTQSMNMLEHFVKVPGTVLVAMLFGVLNGRWVPLQELPAWLRDNLGLEGPVTDASGAAWLGIAMVIGIATSLVFGFILLRRFGYRWGRFDPGLARDYMRFARPLALISALGLVSARVDTVMLGYFWTAQEVGYYWAALRAIMVLMILPQIVQTLFFPLISQLAKTHDPGALREVGVTAQRLLTLVTVGAVMLLVVFPREGIAIFLSRAYLPATPALALLALHIFVGSVRSVNVSIMKGMDRPAPLFTVALIGTTANIILNAVLIPRTIWGIPLAGLGPTGAALATLLAGIISYGWLFHRSRQALGASVWSWSNAKHLTAAMAVGALAWLSRDLPVWGGLDRFYELGGAIAVTLAAYVGVLVLMGEVGRKDWILVREILHPGRMTQYVREEMRGKQD